MAKAEDAIWEMHALLHEMSGGIKAQKERFDQLEKEVSSLKDGRGDIAALREAIESARNQRITIFEKLDRLEVLVASLPPVIPPVADSLIDRISDKRFLIIVGVVGLALGLWTLDDIKGWFTVG